MKDKIPVQILENVCTGIFVWKFSWTDYERQLLKEEQLEND